MTDLAKMEIDEARLLALLVRELQDSAVGRVIKQITANVLQADAYQMRQAVERAMQSVIEQEAFRIMAADEEFKAKVREAVHASVTDAVIQNVIDRITRDR